MRVASFARLYMYALYIHPQLPCDEIIESVHVKRLLSACMCSAPLTSTLYVHYKRYVTARQRASMAYVPVCPSGAIKNSFKNYEHIYSNLGCLINM